MKLGRAPATTRTFIAVREREESTERNVAGALPSRDAVRVLALHLTRS